MNSAATSAMMTTSTMSISGRKEKSFGAGATSSGVGIKVVSPLEGAGPDEPYVIPTRALVGMHEASDRRDEDLGLFRMYPVAAVLHRYELDPRKEAPHPRGVGRHDVFGVRSGQPQARPG